MRLTIASLAALLLCSCVESPYSKAVRLDTIEGYREYLAEHRRSSDAELVRDRLAELEYERARAAHSVVAYKRFIDEFPDSVQALKLEPLLETLRFNAARDRGTVPAWEQFLADHPAGAHREEANRLLADLLRAQAEKSGTSAALGRFVNANPDDPSRASLEERLDQAAADEAVAGGPAKLYAYLRDHPAGAHRQRLQALLFAARVEALLASGLLNEAREEIARSPLSEKLPELAARLTAAEAEDRLRATKDPALRAAQPQSYLRSLETLEQALRDPDAQVRWEAAEELGHHVSVRAIDPLLGALSSGRNMLVRIKAFEALGRVLEALPPEVTRYEVATRVEALRPTASSPELLLRLAALLDLTGDLERAAPEYQRAYDPNLPDALVLHRWVEIRLGRRQAFSAAVAARQLAIVAEQTVGAFEIGQEAGVNLQTARMFCAAKAIAVKATEAIAVARASMTEFPEDVVEFERKAAGIRKLVEARLLDAELALRTQLPEATLCGDRALAERLAAAEQARLSALERTAKGAANRVLWDLARRDPSEKVRALAARLLGEKQPAVAADPVR